jgi:hypothetical protein
MELAEIYIYPVKSLAGISLNQSNVLEKGLEHDRRWMIVDQHQKFITQREFPELALIRMNVTQEGLTFGLNGSEIEIEQRKLGSPVEVEVWSDRVSALESDPKAGEWLSDHLGIHCKLVKMEEAPRTRTIDRQGVSFADGYPYLILGRNSMEDLNQRIGKEMNILRFRPNLVFEGGAPYEEDQWEEFLIGSVRFRGIKPCSRCVLTTVDPTDASKNPEPLKTLSTYRKVENNVLFGLNAIAETIGKVSVGDSIELLKRKQ